MIYYLIIIVNLRVLVTFCGHLQGSDFFWKDVLQSNQASVQL